MNRSEGDEPACALTALCPLCGEEIGLDLPDRRVPARWRDALAHRDKWGHLSAEFRASRSIEVAARRLSISEDESRFLLNFLCTEICGCRLATCVSCLDDYRSEL
ncbi:MAG TPA: hypothetical protein VF747_03295 [Blastocatellia bacterium]